MSDTLSPLIQAALAPVFLLSAIGVTLSVIDTRQNRIVDRVRGIEAHIVGDPGKAAMWAEEIKFYMSRAVWIGWAAAFCILSALSVAFVVVAQLVDAQTEVSLAVFVEAPFTAAVLFYGLSLVLFLRDVLKVNRGLEFLERRLAGAARPGGPGSP